MEALDEEKLKTYQYYHSIMHSNAILCKIKERKWYEALRLCEDGLCVKANDVKLLFLKGQCNLHISNYELAYECFNAVLCIEPLHKEAKEMLELAKQREKDEELNQKNKFRKVFEQWDEDEKQDLEEMKVKIKKKRIEEQQNQKKEVNIEIEREEYVEEEDDIPLESLMKGMVIDTNEPDNMFNQISNIDVEEND